MESLRQEVFIFLDNNPKVDNKTLYKKFEGKSENSLRQYKMQYIDEVTKRDISTPRRIP